VRNCHSATRPGFIFTGPSLREAGLVPGRGFPQATVRAWENDGVGPDSPAIFTIKVVFGLGSATTSDGHRSCRFQVTRWFAKRTGEGECLNAEEFGPRKDWPRTCAANRTRAAKTQPRRRIPPVARGSCGLTIIRRPSCRCIFSDASRCSAADPTNSLYDVGISTAGSTPLARTFRHMTYRTQDLREHGIRDVA